MPSTVAEVVGLYDDVEIKHPALRTEAANGLVLQRRGFAGMWSRRNADFLAAADGARRTMVFPGAILFHHDFRAEALGEFAAIAIGPVEAGEIAENGIAHCAARRARIAGGEPAFPA